MASSGPTSGAKLFQGVEKTSAAFKLMMQMGWEEGTGLGKNKQGITTHVRVSKKNDTAGVGINDAKKAGADWTVNTAVYDTILKNLNVQASGLKEAKVENPEVSSSSESDSDDSEDGDANVPTPPVEIAKPLKLVRPQGRYKRREAGKEVNSYSSTDLSAILGHGTMDNNLPLKVQSAPSKPVVNVDHAAPKEIKVVTPLLSCAVTINFPKLSPSWWGNKHGFVRAGELGSMPVPPSSQITAGKVDGKQSADENGIQSRTAFDEQDQENLYKLVQDNATSGRRGLGIGDATRTVGGAKWEGAKLTFQDGPEENNVSEHGNCPKPVEDEDNGATISDIQQQDANALTEGVHEGQKNKKKKKRKADRECAEEDLVEDKRNKDFKENADDREPSSKSNASVGQSEVVNEYVKVKKCKKSKKRLAENTSDQDEGCDLGNVKDVDPEVNSRKSNKRDGKRIRSSEAEKKAEETVSIGKIEGEQFVEKKSKKRKPKQGTGGQEDAQQGLQKEAEVKSRSSDGKVRIRTVEREEGTETKMAHDHGDAQRHDNGNSTSEEKKGERKRQKIVEVNVSKNEKMKNVAKSDPVMNHEKDMPLSGSKLKWKKLIAEALTQGPAQGLKIKKLQKQVLTVASSFCGINNPPEAELVAAFRKALEGGSSFLVEGNLVRYDRGGA